MFHIMSAIIRVEIVVKLVGSEDEFSALECLNLRAVDRRGPKMSNVSTRTRNDCRVSASGRGPVLAPEAACVEHFDQVVGAFQDVLFHERPCSL